MIEVKERETQFYETEKERQQNEIQTELEKTKEVVEGILSRHEEARNNDIFLILKVWEEVSGAKLNISPEETKGLMPPSTISRVRRKIQNDEGEFLPTNPGVMHKRKIREEMIRDYYKDDNGKFTDYIKHVYGVQ